MDLDNKVNDLMKEWIIFRDECLSRLTEEDKGHLIEFDVKVNTKLIKKFKIKLIKKFNINLVTKMVLFTILVYFLIIFYSIFYFFNFTF